MTKVLVFLITIEMIISGNVENNRNDFCLLKRIYKKGFKEVTFIQIWWNHWPHFFVACQKRLCLFVHLSNGRSISLLVWDFFLVKKCICSLAQLHVTEFFTLLVGLNVVPLGYDWMLNPWGSTFLISLLQNSRIFPDAISKLPSSILFECEPTVQSEHATCKYDLSVNILII